MEKTDAIAALSALAHDTRIDIFRLLIRTGGEGAAAGEIASALEIRPATLSNNLTVLSAAGLIRSRREGRSIRYFARLDGVRGLLSFLMEECCGGRPELCRPTLDTFIDPATDETPT